MARSFPRLGDKLHRLEQLTLGSWPRGLRPALIQPSSPLKSESAVRPSVSCAERKAWGFPAKITNGGSCSHALSFSFYRLEQAFRSSMGRCFAEFA
jgi:hypothetical protein